MKKAVLICALIVCLILPTVVLVAYAHSGRTDSRGGHTNHSTGEYHYHHGYSAHDHYDMDGDGVKDCPYNFDDQTERKNPSDSPNTKASKSKNSFPILGLIIAVVLYALFMFILPFIMS